MVRQGSEESIRHASRMDLLQWYHPTLEGSGDDPKLGSHVAESFRVLVFTRKEANTFLLLSASLSANISS